MSKREEILKKKTVRGGWTAKSLAEWGITWPPIKGWKKKLEQESE